MPRKFKATLRYDGTGFSGWQVQPGQRTVQGVIEEALATIAGQDVRVIGAGRTDAGVHALAQVFHVVWDGPQPPESLCRSLSKMLGPEIRIEGMEEAPENFHAIPIRQRRARSRPFVRILRGIIKFVAADAPTVDLNLFRIPRARYAARPRSIGAFFRIKTVGRFPAHGRNQASTTRVNPLPRTSPIVVHQHADDIGTFFQTPRQIISIIIFIRRVAAIRASPKIFSVHPQSVRAVGRYEYFSPLRRGMYIEYFSKANVRIV